MSRLTLRVALVALLCLLAAPPALALTYRDMTGREMILAGPPTRIVSLVPSVTELIYALGGEARLVGRTDFCDYPPAALQKPSVGGMIAPSLEAIAALRADLVVATTAGNREETFLQLRRLGLPTYVVNADRVVEVFDLVGRVGELTGRPSAVASLVAQMNERIARIRARVQPYRTPRVLYVLWPDPLIVPGRHALVTELIEIAGGRSVTAVDGDAYPRYSLEAAVAASPEVILLASHGSRTGAHVKDTWERLASLPAIKGGRLYSVDGDLMHRYGPRMIDGLAQIARAIHPEAFK
ncbi:MAG: ABC transporter substrate-binding protein [Candidatus Rokuibacteriota bacterium]